MAERRVAVAKRVDLSSFLDGWTGSYVIVTLATGQEMMDIAELDPKSMTKKDILKYELDAVAKHFVSGQIPIIADDGSFELTAMVAEDLQASAELVDRVYATVVGVELDPKGMPTGAGDNKPSSTN